MASRTGPDRGPGRSDEGASSTAFACSFTLAFSAYAAVAVAAVPKCFGKRATIVGTNRRDVLRGTSGPDVIVAKGGNDTIFGRGGGDRICAGDGNDEVLAGGGADMVSGGAGRDFIDGGGGADLLQGDGGADDIFGWTGNDVLQGGGGSDLLFGEDGNDRLLGGGGNDFLLGGQGDDQYDGGAGLFDLASFQFLGADGLAGGGQEGVVANLADGTATGEGNDTLTNIEGLVGSDLDDVLTGDDGENGLIGRLGSDTIAGGAGDDFLHGGVPFSEEPDPGNDFGDGGDGFDECVDFDLGKVQNCEIVDPLTGIQSAGAAPMTRFRTALAWMAALKR